MSAAKFMNILAQRDQQYLENPQFNSYQQFKQAIQTLGFQQTQSTIMKFKNQCTPPTSDNSPYFFSKQEQWQKNQDLLAQQVNSSSTKSYRAIYPNKKLTSLEERYQQHNSQSSFMNKVLSSEPSPLLQLISYSVDIISLNHLITCIRYLLSKRIQQIPPLTTIQYKSQSPSLKDKDQSEMSQIQYNQQHLLNYNRCLIPFQKSRTLRLKSMKQGESKKKKLFKQLRSNWREVIRKKAKRKALKKSQRKQKSELCKTFQLKIQAKKPNEIYLLKISSYTTSFLLIHVHH